MIKTMATLSPDDGELLRQWLDRGDEPSFRLLVDRYAGLVYHAAYRTGGNAATADEAAQLTFIILARKASQLRSRNSLAGWLHRTAILQTRNLLRTQRREERKNFALTAMTPDPQAEPSQAWREMSPVLDDALAALPERDREAILMRFYRSLSFPEIAAAAGIASDAARKRVERAIVRLRTQLARRGCHIGTAVCLGALTQLGAQAKAGTLSSAVLATQAIAAATSTTTLSTTTIAIIMTKKAAITTGAIVLIAGAGAVAIINRSDSQTPSPSAADANSSNRSSAARPAFGESPTEAVTRPRPRDPVENPEFVDEYGESRTKLSKHVANTVIALLDDAVSMGEMAASGELGGALGGRRAAMRAGLGGVLGDLNLTDDQQKQAETLYADFQQRELAMTKTAVDKLRKDPQPLMRVMLASDAYSRGEITEDQYKTIQATAEADLQGVMNPLDRRNFQGGRPFSDNTFREEMLAVLEPGQAETFQAAATEQAARDAETTGSITEMPAMDLEQLDKTVTSAKTLTAGVRQMMEGLGGLQDLGPMLEEQRRQQEQRGGE